MKLGVLINPMVHTVLEKLSNEPMPAKTAIKFKKAIEIVRAEFDAYEALRLGALQKYGKKTDSGEFVVSESNDVTFEEGKFEEFSQEMYEAFQKDVALPSIKVSELGGKFSLSARDLELLEGFIVDK